MKKLLNRPAFTLTFYVLALLMFMYSVYSFYTVYVYIGSLVDAGSITWTSNIGDVIQYFMNNGFNYVFYGLVLVGFGTVYNVLKPKPALEEVTENQDEEVEVA